LGVEGRRCECEKKQKATGVRSIFHVCDWRREIGGKLAVWMGF
jgi:hypothetical protein